LFILTLFQDPSYFFSVVVVVIISISVHECFHALAALSQGDDTAARQGRTTLNPMAHMSQTAVVLLMLLGITWGSTPVDESRLKGRFSPAIVGFAGPFANLLMMVLSVWAVLLLGHFRPVFPQSWSVLQSVGIDFFSLAAMLNAFLFLLNMLPIPPLDGFGILETFIPVLRRYSLSLSQYGFFILIVLFMFLGLGKVLMALAELMVWKVTGFTQGMVSAL
jgi:Zn-dependent protease